MASTAHASHGNKQHVLHSTLSGTMDTKYHLRLRPHNFKLTAKNSSITECDFITRLLFKDVCCHYVLFIAISCITIDSFRRGLIPPMLGVFNMSLKD